MQCNIFQITMPNGLAFLVDIKVHSENVTDWEIVTVMAQCQALDGQIQWVNVASAHTPDSWAMLCMDLEAFIQESIVAEKIASESVRPKLRLVK